MTGLHFAANNIGLSLLIFFWWAQEFLFISAVQDHPSLRSVILVLIKATGNSRSGSQKFPLAQCENSRYEKTPIHPLCRRKVIKIVIYLPTN